MSSVVNNILKYGQFKSPYKFDGLIDVGQPSLWLSVASICFNPLFWNIVAQNEYRRKTITKALGNKPYYGCYLLGATIFLLGIVRDHFFQRALYTQPSNELLAHPAIRAAGVLLFIAGQTFVLSSMWALGVTGTYLGDYFGILMDGIVKGFPFNVMGDPMYWGSSMCFAGYALYLAKPAGLVLTGLVVVVYIIALRFEGPFTANIYAQAAKKVKRRASTKRLSTGAASTPKATKSVSRKKSTASLKGEKASANGDVSTSSTTSTGRKPRASTSRPRKSSSKSAKSS